MTDEGKITIWGRRTSVNVMKVVWCAHELGLDYDRIDVGLEFGIRNAPDYASINPNLTVPAIRDGGLVLWESNVIVRYLCEKYGRGTLWPEGPAARWLGEQWMDWMQTTLNPPMGVILRQLYRTPKEEQDLAAVETARLGLCEKWAILEADMQGRDYIAGDTFSMADIPLGASAYRWFNYDIERPDMPSLRAFYDRLCKREGYREHVLMPVG